MISSRTINADLLPRINDMQMERLRHQQESGQIPEVTDYASNLGYQLVSDGGNWVIYERDPFSNDSWLVMEVFPRLSDAKNKLQVLKQQEDKRYDDMYNDMPTSGD